MDGNLTVLIDNKMYNSWSFSKSETILIPTYNPASFYNNSIKNIDVGIHNISLIFCLNTFNNHVPVVSKDDSGLKFKFNVQDDDFLNNKYACTYTSLLNIQKKKNHSFITSE